MSVKQLFEDQKVEYLLPTAVGASVGDPLTLAADGTLQFGLGANATITATYSMSVAGGAGTQGMQITFVNSAGVTSAFCVDTTLATATAGNVGPSQASFSLVGAISPALANILPASGEIVRTTTAFICDQSGGTWLGDLSIDENGDFNFICESGSTFVNGVEYQLGVTTTLGITGYFLGSWPSST